MDATLERRLARLQNRPTLWEIVAVSESGERILLGYADRWTRAMQRTVILPKLDALATMTGVTEWEWLGRVADGLTGFNADGQGWKITKSGRTKRDAILSDELPWRF